MTDRQCDRSRETSRFDNDPVHQVEYSADGHVERKSSPLWKQYMRGYVACHFHLTTTVGELPHRYHLCADFQVAPGPSPKDFLGAGTLEGSTSKAEHRGAGKDWCEHLVLVSVGKVSEGTEEAIRILSLVGLGRVDDCPVRRRDVAEMYPFVTEPLASVLDRELNPLALSGRSGHSNVAAIQLPKQEVEGATQVVNHVSYDDAYPKPPFLWECCDPKDVIASSRVTFGPNLDLVRFALDDGSDYGIETIFMLTRPVNLSPTSTQVDSHLSPRGIE